MARQKGIMKVDGSLGDVSFYKTKHGYLARGKSGVSADRIRGDDVFQRTRENAAEFGRASKAGKLLRNALHPLLLVASDTEMVSRLTQEMTRVIKTDWANARGARTIAGGKTDILTGFEFNKDAALQRAFYGTFSVDISRDTGMCMIQVPSFIPVDMLSWPPGATHFRFMGGAAALDFDGSTFRSDTVKGDPLLIGEMGIAPVLLTMVAPGSAGDVLFVVFGVEFVQYVNGRFYDLSNGMYNCLAVVRVEKGE